MPFFFFLLFLELFPFPLNENSVCGSAAAMIRGLLSQKAESASTPSSSVEKEEDIRNDEDEGGNSTVSEKKEGIQTDFLTSFDQKQLLRLAYATLNGATSPLALTKGIQMSRGLFVTLKKHKKLRGCIGHIIPQMPLYKAVPYLTIQSATKDNRFSPVTSDEVKDIRINLSILSKPIKINSLEEITLGKHGVILTKDGAQGIFLPEVATEQGWEKDKLIKELCVKTGLPSDCYPHPNAQLSVFTTQHIE